MNAVIELQNKKLLWQGSHHHHTLDHQLSGFSVFDTAVGGFPTTGVIELNADLAIGELRLISHALQQQSEQKLIVFINPPGALSADAFQAFDINIENILVINTDDEKKALWSAEQCLKSGACGAVTLWHKALEIHQAKRLQVASESGQCLHFFFNTQQSNPVSLPIPLSLRLSGTVDGLNVEVKKRRGGWIPPSFHLDMSTQWPELTHNTDNDNVVPIHFNRHRA
jgi:cell division inhibitor SulA